MSGTASYRYSDWFGKGRFAAHITADKAPAPPSLPPLNPIGQQARHSGVNQLLAFAEIALDHRQERLGDDFAAARTGVDSVEI